MAVLKESVTIQITMFHCITIQVVGSVDMLCSFLGWRMIFLSHSL